MGKIVVEDKEKGISISIHTSKKGEFEAVSFPGDLVGFTDISDMEAFHKLLGTVIDWVKSSK